MLIPHSERSALNFHVRVATILLFFMTLLAAVGVFVYLSSRHIGTSAIMDTQQQEMRESRENLDAALAEIRNVLRVAQAFDAELVETINSLGLSPEEPSTGSGGTAGDLAEFSNLQVVSEDRAREIQDLRNAAGRLGEAVEPLQEVRRVLESRESLLADIPNMWPLKDGLGRVMTEFGPSINPVTGRWYLHPGIAISGTPGSPVVASANGRVVEMGYDRELGLYVLLRHKYGFRTRYSRLQSITVREGEDLVQGEQIGTLGSTGLSSGSYLGFTVKIGTDVVDPATFLKVSSPGVGRSSP